jgi:hypothetical protein
MERRSFFKLLGATLLPIPDVLTTNTVEEVMAVVNPHKYGTIDWFFTQEAHRIGSEIYSKVLTGKEPWTRTYQQP